MMVTNIEGLAGFTKRNGYSCENFTQGVRKFWTTFLTKTAVPKFCQTFWGTPFLEKGPPKITEGGPFDPHLPIS